MQRFKNILVFTDGGPRSTVVLERAAALAKRNGAQLTALSVLESLPRDLQRLVAAIHPADLWELAVLERQKKLDGLVARSWKSDLNFTTKVLGGSPSIEVIKEVLRRNHDIVLMAAEGEGGVKDLLFGSTSTHLMRECPCPVWVMKSAQFRFTGDGRVMAAVDPIATDRGHESLNHKIMQLASSLARIERTRLYVVHAWLPATEPISVFGRLPLSAPDLVADTRQEHQEALDKLLRESDLDGLGTEVHLVRGEASRLIPRLAVAKRIDLIVMGTVCRAGVPGLLIGNTAEKVLRKVSCSVLTVKPEGFVSPVACEPRPTEDGDPLPSETAMTQTAAGDQQRESC